MPIPRLILERSRIRIDFCAFANRPNPDHKLLYLDQKARPPHNARALGLIRGLLRDVQAVEEQLQQDRNYKLKEGLLVLFTYQRDIDQGVQAGGELMGERIANHLHLPYMLSVSSSEPLT